MRTVVVALATMLPAVGCDPDSRVPSRNSCDASATQYLVCFEWGPLEGVDLLNAMTACDAYKGAWRADAACPTENLVASCRLPGGCTYYYAGTPDLAWLQERCTADGHTWTTYP